MRTFILLMAVLLIGINVGRDQTHAQSPDKVKPQTRISTVSQPMRATQWSQRGPFGVLRGSYYTSGRTTAVDYNGPDLYVGAATGGLWHLRYPFLTQPICDQLPTLSIGSFAVHPTSIDTIYLGTGEYHFSWRGTGCYRTTDGGDTWDLMGLPSQPTQVSKVSIAPWDPSIIYISGNNGLHKSIDYGVTWSNPPVLEGDVSDFAFTVDGGFMLAGKAGLARVYRSFDRGETWQELLIPGAGTLGSANSTKVAVAVANYPYGYAYVQITDTSKVSPLTGLWRSSDARVESPVWVNLTPNLLAAFGGIATNYVLSTQSRRNNHIGVHPFYGWQVVAGGVKLAGSNDFGDTWVNMNVPHGDITTIRFRENGNLYIGNDGGVFVTDDFGGGWNSSANLLLPITQFRNIDISQKNPNIAGGASHDNGSAWTLDGNAWFAGSLGDGIDVAIDWRNDETIYYSRNSVKVGDEPTPRTWGILKSVDGGTTWNTAYAGVHPDDVAEDWRITIAIDPRDQNLLYTNAGKYVYWSRNGGSTWSRLNTNPFESNVNTVRINSSGDFLYVPVKWGNQLMMGMQLNSLAGSWFEPDTIRDGLPFELVTNVSTSPTDENRAYALMVDNNPQPGTERVYKTTNKGDNWTNISGDLPNISVFDLIEHPTNPGILWIGTDRGAYRTTNGGVNWFEWNSGMPKGALLSDLEYVAPEIGQPYLVAGTYGRSTFVRPIGTDPVFTAYPTPLDLASAHPGESKSKTLYVKNMGDESLYISSASSGSPYFSVTPSGGVLLPGDSMEFYVTLLPQQHSGAINGTVEFIHNGDGSPSYVMVKVYVGDPTMFRTFKPEDLIVKKPIKRKSQGTSWCFAFGNSHGNPLGAPILNVEFRNRVQELSSHEPFGLAENPDGRGKNWVFSKGVVGGGASAFICGKTAKTKPQSVVQWWWTQVAGEDEAGGEPSLERQGMASPYFTTGAFEMPNTANLREEIFKQRPIGRNDPLVIGVADPTAREKGVAYVALAKHQDVYNSLAKGKTMIRHTGPPRCFDLYDNGKKMRGVLRRLEPTMQNNRLFAELVALKLNILGSAMGKTPLGFGELKFVDPGHRFNGLTIRQIDSIASYFMTYCDTNGIGSAVELDSVINKINCSFEGPIDTITFATKLRFTGVKPVTEVPFLERDSTIIPQNITPGTFVSGDSDGFEVYQNYPNPFNPTTTLEFYLPDAALVTLKVYNILGQEVGKLLDRQELEEGISDFEFDGNSLPSGVYFYRIVAEILNDDEREGDRFVQVRKMIIMR